jgi:hypothetical protein
LEQELEIFGLMMWFVVVMRHHWMAVILSLGAELIVDMTRTSVSFVEVCTIDYIVLIGRKECE